MPTEIFLGDEKFVGSMQSLINIDKQLSEIPILQRRAVPKALFYYAENYEIRNEAIISAYVGGGYSLKEIGDYFDLHYSIVSEIIKNHKSKTPISPGDWLQLPSIWLSSYRNEVNDE